MQDTFERIWRNAASIRSDTIRALTRTTLLNLARSRFRRLRRERKASSVIDRAAHAPGPDPSMHDEVWRALKTLSPRQRACIALRYYEGMSEQEVASTLGMNAGTVKAHTHRGMTKLRELLGDGGIER